MHIKKIKNIFGIFKKIYIIKKFDKDNGSLVCFLKKKIKIKII